MTTLAAAEHLTVGGLAWDTWQYLLQKVTGLDDLPAARHNDVPLPGTHGTEALNALYDSRSFDAELLVFGMDASGAVATTEAQVARTNLDAFKQVAAASLTSLQSVARTMPDGSTRTAQARFLDALSIENYDELGTIFLAKPKLFLPDPAFYGATIVETAEVFSSSPHSWNVTNPGNLVAYKILIDILGPAHNVRITNTTNNSWVEIDVSVIGTKHLVVDCELYTALNDGTSVIGSLSHSGAIPFLTLDPGVNALTATATGLSGATRITLTIKPPYV